MGAHSTVSVALAVLVLHLAGCRSITDSPATHDARRDASAAEEFEAVAGEYEAAKAAFNADVSTVGTDAERNALFRSKEPRASDWFDRMRSIADRQRTNDVGAQALVWIASHARRRDWPEFADAVRRLLAEHRASPVLARACEQLARDESPAASEALLELALHAPDRRTRAEATMALASQRRTLAEIVRMLQGGGETAANWASFLSEAHGSEVALRLSALDPAQLELEREAHLERLASQFADCPLARGGTYGEWAEGELFELRRLAIGMLAPEIVGPDLEGDQMRLSDFRGRVVVLHFWGDWCASCRGLYAHERELVERRIDRPFTMLGVNSDAELSKLRTVMEREGLTWRSWRNEGSPAGPISTQWNVHAWPATYVLDAAGVIRYRDVQFADLEAAVDSLLAELDEAQEAPSTQR